MLCVVLHTNSVIIKYFLSTWNILSFILFRLKYDPKLPTLGDSSVELETFFWSWSFLSFFSFLSRLRSFFSRRSRSFSSFLSCLVLVPCKTNNQIWTHSVTAQPPHTPFDQPQLWRSSSRNCEELNLDQVTSWPPAWATRWDHIPTNIKIFTENFHQDQDRTVIEIQNYEPEAVHF